jgi:cytohesin
MRPIEYKDSYDPYELMMVPPHKKSEMILEEIKKDIPNLNLIQDLIILGADLKWQDEDNDGWTLLHWAAFFGRVEIVRMLIDAGADLNVQDEYGRSPLIWSAYYDNIEEIARVLIDGGADVNIQDNYGWTPLHMATKWENVEMVQILVNAGARTDIQDNYRRIPYDLADTEELKNLLKP